MQDESTEVIPARAKAEALLRAGRLSEARGAARDGLSGEGSDAGLYAVLGRAHAAEDDDDHDDRAEAVFKEGLASFPDDLDLLAAYAELCARADYMERPVRHRLRGELAARLRELAPDSPQALQAAQTAGGGGSGGPKPPSAVRVQRLEAQRVIRRGAGERERVRELAAARPLDARLAVLDETLTALERRGRGLLRFIVRAPGTYALVLLVLYVAVLLAVPVFRLPWWVMGAGVLLSVPGVALKRLLKGARERAVRRELPSGAVESAEDEASLLPPVPGYTRRDQLQMAAALTVLLAAAVGSGVWQNAQYREYPHYTASVPDTFRGLQEVVDAPILDTLDSELGGDLGREGIESFRKVYVDDPDGEPAGTIAVLFGVHGDMHEMSARDVDSFLDALQGGLVPTTSDRWDAAPGAYGGWMRCLTATYPTGEVMGACTWGDKGSMGTVMLAGSDFDQHDRKGVEDFTRALRQTVLHPA
ncbi:hypothetical protein [Streptomyces sp. NBC_01465]|uniref:hypothetical protein n=1 Tax=Streptomyces sp. NBC_01465 TaxID=2903878 RepID=UPI002E331AFD|nr:hypothetical protein [Streptomyces sp. NBC_01465]